ncbi:hypothetical protein Hte_006898 [Hypoxylon texense]
MPKLKLTSKALQRLFRSSEAESQLTSAESASAVVTEPNLTTEEPVSSATTELQAIRTEPREKHGLFVLVEKPSELEGGIDIVAIHGLNGHYIETWSAQVPGSDQRYNWLEAALPDAIPNARIMSFGYDSAVFSQSVADINDYAQQLLVGLLVKRHTAAERARPILFLCHSLGGIVFKKALIQAHEHNRYNALLKEIKGVAFFGTPHRGSSVANWATLLGNLVKVIPTGMRTTILKGLKTNSRELQGISQSFVERGAELNITSFYEMYKLDGAKLIIVPKDSALLHLPNEHTVALNGDHRSICKFTRKGDPTLEVVLNSIGEMVEAIPPEAIPPKPAFVTNLSLQQQSKCLRDLHPGNYEDFKDFNVARTPGTCEWFLQHRQYKEWLAEEQSSLLWISADAGCGKSTLAKFLVEHLRSVAPSNGNQVSICHFFFKEGVLEQQGAVSALRAILHQIFSQREALRTHLFSEYENEGSARMNEYIPLFTILKGVISGAESANVVCILDGLDECPSNDVAKLLRSINEFYHEQESIRSAQQLPYSMSYLKLIVLSRPETLIKRTLGIYQYTIRLKGEDETSTIDHDISLVIKERIEDLQEEMGLPSVILDDFARRLKADAGSTFLWATLLLNILRDRYQIDGGVSQRELLDLVNGRDIFSVYEFMLGKIHAKPDSIKMLQIIIAAQTPLTIEEMSIALAVLPSHKTLEDIFPDIKYPREDYIKALCGNFIRIIHGKLYLVHQTAREFLLDTQAHSSAENTWQHSVSIHEANRTLLRACITYVSCGERSGWKDSLSLRMDSESNTRYNDRHQIVFQKLADIHPFLEYAATRWTIHFKLSKLTPEADLFKEVVEFCQPLPSGPGYPYWTFASIFGVSYGDLHRDQNRDLTHFERHARIIFWLQLDDLMKHFSELHFQDKTDNGDSLIHIAAGVDSVRGCRCLADLNIDINALNAESNTALDIAIKYCYLDVADALVKAGGSFSWYREPICSLHNQAALHCALFGRCDELAELLVKRGSKWNSLDSKGRTPIRAALSMGRRSFVERLLSLSTDPNSRKNAIEELAYLKTQDIESDEESRFNLVVGHFSGTGG